MVDTVPFLNDPQTQQFVDMLAGNPSIRLGSGYPTPVYDDNFHPYLVEHEPPADARPLKCWFNCLHEQEKGRGTVVYGWAIWLSLSRNVRMFFAQHHAVLRTSSGLLDVTPYINSNNQSLELLEPILFVPDQRVPLELTRGRVPSCFLWDTIQRQTHWAVKNDQGLWQAFEAGYTLIKFEEEDTWFDDLPKSVKVARLKMLTDQ